MEGGFPCDLIVFDKLSFKAVPLHKLGIILDSLNLSASARYSIYIVWWCYILHF